MLSVEDYAVFLLPLFVVPVRSFGCLLIFILLSIAMRKWRNLMHMHISVLPLRNWQIWLMNTCGMASFFAQLSCVFNFSLSFNDINGCFRFVTFVLMLSLFS